MTTWPDGTPRSRGNAFDWRQQPVDPRWGRSSQMAELGRRGAQQQQRPGRAGIGRTPSRDKLEAS